MKPRRAPLCGKNFRTILGSDCVEMCNEIQSCRSRAKVQSCEEFQKFVLFSSPCCKERGGKGGKGGKGGHPKKENPFNADD